jgi:hypothetical protein
MMSGGTVGAITLPVSLPQLKPPPPCSDPSGCRGRLR